MQKRGVLKAIRDEVKSAKESGDSSALAVNKLVDVIQTYSKREQAMEKMVTDFIIARTPVVVWQGLRLVI